MSTIESAFFFTLVFKSFVVSHAAEGGERALITARALITPQSVATLLYCNLDAELPH